LEIMEEQSMSTESLYLLPVPRHLEMLAGVHTLADSRLLLLDVPDPAALLPAAHKLQRALRERTHLVWEATASTTAPAEAIGLALRVDPRAVRRTQGYRLSIKEQGITIEAHDSAGAYYAVCTLAQIIERCGRALPCLHISDWPDYPARGVMLDISRDRVPSMQTLHALVDMLAGWKINQLQLYTEHTFAYHQHPEVWADASPVTGQEIMALDAFCRERYVELVPNQNSFGHFERWLVHPRYAPLSEGATPNMTLCPTDPGSLELVRSLYDELLPHFASTMFNVGCDETQVGSGRSKDECARRGVGRVYLDFLLAVYKEVTKRGRIMQFWGDIIMNYPELIPELPKDTVALEWGYEADHPFAEHGARFASSGIPFYVCPGTSSWNSLAGRTDNALANIRNAAENGLRHGAIGLLNTDWGDRGHWQALPISYLGFAAGAAYSWCVKSAPSLDLPQALSMHAFADSSGEMGRLAYDLGNVYRTVGVEPRNSTVPFHVLQMPLGSIREKFPTIRAEDYALTLDAISQAMRQLTRERMRRSDAQLIKDEFLNTARLLQHSCRRGLLALEGGADGPEEARRQLNFDMMGIIQEYSRLWLARNRPGGLADSVRRLEKARVDYNWRPHAPYEW
jgi:hexosaminidase